MVELEAVVEEEGGEEGADWAVEGEGEKMVS